MKHFLTQISQEVNQISHMDSLHWLTEIYHTLKQYPTQMEGYSQITTDSNRVWCLHVVFVIEYQNFNQNNTLWDVGDCSGFWDLGKMMYLKLSTFQNSFCIAIATLAQPTAWVWGGAICLPDQWQTVVFRKQCFCISVCWHISSTRHISRDLICYFPSYASLPVWKYVWWLYIAVFWRKS